MDEELPFTKLPRNEIAPVNKGFTKRFSENPEAFVEIRDPAYWQNAVASRATKPLLDTARQKEIDDRTADMIGRFALGDYRPEDVALWNATAEERAKDTRGADAITRYMQSETYLKAEKSRRQALEDDMKPPSR